MHLIVPAYFGTIALVWFLSTPSDTSRAALLRDLIAISGRFVFGYSALIGFAALTAWLVEWVLRARRDRRLARDPAAPARRSAARLQTALAIAELTLAGDPDGCASAALAALRAAPWDHADMRAQALTRDLDDVVDAFERAIATAEPSRRAAIRTAAADTLDHLAKAAQALAAEHREDHERGARTIARYVEVRYSDNPEPDFSGSQPG